MKIIMWNLDWIVSVKCLVGFYNILALRIICELKIINNFFKQSVFGDGKNIKIILIRKDKLNMVIGMHYILTNTIILSKIKL